MCRLKSFLCCMSVRTGLIIIGIVGVFIGIFMPPIILHVSRDFHLPPIDTIFHLVESVLSLAFSVVLLVAIFEESRLVMIVWLIFQIINVLVDTGFDIVILSLEGERKTEYTHYAYAIVLTTFRIYAILLGYSFYADLRDREMSEA